MNLVIVESPSKVKTIKQYLGNDYQILASFGHVRDLLPKKGSVDLLNNFAMHYVVQEKAEKHLQAIIKAFKKAEMVYLATDPDREGEAIAWHIVEILREKKLLKNKLIKRITFHEITKNAVINALKEPRELYMPLINAQQARRALDFLVGFSLSPLLWKKIRYGLSAGRVQSPALRMIVEREEEIKQFKKQEYWSILAKHNVTGIPFESKLFKIADQKVENFTFTTQESVEKCIAKIIERRMLVEKIVRKEKKRYPAPPFITSTLQQEASKKLGFSAKKTMSIAQKLYENGYITYMRTDSVALSAEAVQMLRTVINTDFGAEALPKKPNIYQTKAKNAQEAHEAIRPSKPLKPEQLKLTEEQAQLYRLIWQRAVASQMLPAIFAVSTVDLRCQKDYLFRTSGSSLLSPGFLLLYGKDEIGAEEKSNLPVLQEGEWIETLEILGKQHFTEPPPRYSEASLIKTLEEYGIGRPSTYATIIDTLLSRNYVVLENKRFYPKDIGEIVNYFLTKYFEQYVDYEFTAHLETSLDDIAEGKLEWLQLLQQFWQPFEHRVEEIGQTVSKQDLITEQTDEKCPECGANLVIKLGKNGKFLSCSTFPNCHYIASVDNSAEVKTSDTESIAETIVGTCPVCGGNLIKKKGRFGFFIGCSNYPQCKHIEPLNKPEDTKIVCPVCQQRNLIKKRSRKGKIFYACANYPNCKYALWNIPINEPCPKCHWPILTVKPNNPDVKICPNEHCQHSFERKDN